MTFNKNRKNNENKLLHLSHKKFSVISCENSLTNAESDAIVLIRRKKIGGGTMNKVKVVRKAEAGEGLTVAEIKVYQKEVKPQKHVYGKYGTLAKQYLEDKGIDWTIANLPEYLHGVDKAADELYETMYEKFSKEERFKKSEDFMENLKRETEMQRLIEEEILNEIVYVR